MCEFPAVRPRCETFIGVGSIMDVRIYTVTLGQLKAIQGR